MAYGSEGDIGGLGDESAHYWSSTQLGANSASRIWVSGASISISINIVNLAFVLFAVFNYLLFNESPKGVVY